MRFASKWLAAMAVVVFSCGTGFARDIEQPMPLGENLTVEAVLTQHEVAVDVPDNSAVGAQFGLIGALIAISMDNAAAKKAEGRAVNLRNKLVGYDFNQAFESAMKAKLPSPGISTAPVFVLMHSGLDAKSAPDQQGTALHALQLTPRYSFSNDFSRLVVRVTAQVVERTPKDNGKFKTAIPFSRTYAYTMPLAVAGKVEENVDHWEHMTDATLSALLDKAIAQTLDMVVFDFSSEGRAQWNLPRAKTTLVVQGASYPGSMVLRQESDYGWLRVGTGRLQSLQGYQPILMAAIAPATATPATTPVSAPVAAPPAPAASQAPASEQKSAPTAVANPG